MSSTGLNDGIRRYTNRIGYIIVARHVLANLLTRIQDRVANDAVRKAVAALSTSKFINQQIPKVRYAIEPIRLLDLTSTEADESKWYLRLA